MGSNRQTSVAPPGFAGGDSGEPFQRPPRFMDRGPQTWGSTAVQHQGAWAATAAYIPRGPAGIPDEAYGGPTPYEEAYGVDRPLTGFRSRTPRNTSA
ncbi:MAG: hypothetical protein REI11_01505 [Patulibacter sp.]|nr:hypothetical protein [Patulibacter sp.]